MNLVAAFQQPVDVVHTAPARVNPQNCVLALLWCQFQIPLYRLHKRLQGHVQLRDTLIGTLNNNLLGLAGDFVSSLPPTAIALFGEVNFACKGRFPAAGAPSHIDFQQLPPLAVVMVVSAAMHTVNLAEHLLHLLHVLRRAGILLVLNRRLVGISFPTKGGLRGRGAVHGLVEFHHLMRPSQAGHQTIHQLLKQSVLQHFLSNLNLRHDRFKHFEFPQLHANSDQGGWAENCLRTCSLVMVISFIVMGLLFRVA